VPPPEFLRAQLEAISDDIVVDAVKIGMLADAEVIGVVADWLDAVRPPVVVLDPVMVATSGDRLIAPDTVQVLVEELFPLATVVTPNLDEAALLLDRAIISASELETAARDLLALGASAVLLKGGHLPGDEVTDLLVSGDGPAQRLASPRIASRNTHGTGCTLSSAIAAYLALGDPLDQAVAKARRYILQAIAMGADVYTGAGHGPLNHGHAPVAQIKRARA
jgi:hydroxymethylpyrimidine/phosphomethylpyrimidine kinase